jgi:hypothetical protein
MVAIVSPPAAVVVAVNVHDIGSAAADARTRAERMMPDLSAVRQSGLSGLSPAGI